MTSPAADNLDAPKLEHYDLPALIAEALAMDDVCARTQCVAPTVHLLAHLLREAVEALAGVRARNERLEEALRREWWLNHGHSGSALYGDDGEMQCGACPRDFKREDLDELEQSVLVTRAVLAEGEAQ